MLTETTLETIGILSGLAAAVCHSVSYLFSRLFVIQRQSAVMRLLVAAHLIMGVMSLVLLPFVWTAELPPLRNYVLPLFGAAFFYLAGQAGLFFMVKRTDSSRVAPLLGFKIVILALLVVLFMGQHLKLQQWLAVILSVAATLALSQTGGALPLRTILWLATTCTAYSLSDLSIAGLVKGLAPLSPLRASIVGVCFSYILCGMAGLILLPWSGGAHVWDDWRYALPFAAAWMLAMVFLYVCFGLIGPVYGNILQSTRGIISIFIGAYLARIGMEHLEQKVSRWVLLRRVAAAILMCVAIWLFKR
jgi:drug/metabolite transporter (DMT)-like permease